MDPAVETTSSAAPVRKAGFRKRRRQKASFRSPSRNRRKEAVPAIANIRKVLSGNTVGPEAAWYYIAVYTTHYNGKS
jgi:hypothetical protein